MPHLARLILLLIPPRGWTEYNGKYSTEAELIGYYGGTIPAME